MSAQDVCGKESDMESYKWNLLRYIYHACFASSLWDPSTVQRKKGNFRKQWVSWMPAHFTYEIRALGNWLPNAVIKLGSQWWHWYQHSITSVEVNLEYTQFLFQHCITSISQHPTNQIVKKFNIRTLSSEKIPVPVTLMTFVTLAAPASYCEPGFGHEEN